MDSDDDDFGGMDAGNQGYSSKRFYDDEKEERQFKRKQDRKKDRKQARADAKQQRIQAQQDWAEKNRQKRQEKEEARLEEKRKKQKAAYEAQLKKRGHITSVQESKMTQKQPAQKSKKEQQQQQQKKKLTEPTPTARQKRGRDLEEGKEEVPDKSTAAPQESAPAPSKYVVPARRGGDAAGRIRNMGVVAEIRSLVNKLSLDNIGTIASQLGDLFSMGTYSRLDVMTALNQELLKNCFKTAHLSSNSALTYAALIRCLQLEHSNDAISTILEFTCSQLEEFIMNDDKKGAVGAAVLIGHLYEVFVCDAGLPVSTLQWLLESAEEEEERGQEDAPASVEAALALLKICGASLRQKVPVALNKVVHKLTSSESISRHKVLLDLIKAIASGKTSVLVQQSMEKGDQTLDTANLNLVVSGPLSEAVKKTNGKLPTRAVKQAVETMSVLSLSFYHCVEPNKAPRWYTQKFDLLGAADEGFRTLDNGEDQAMSDDEEQENEDEDLSEDELAQKEKMVEIKKLRAKEKALSGQRFGSEVKRAIFECIAESTDDQECFAMLLRRDPRGKQVAEAAAVLIQCCAQEETYNPFYGLVLQRLLGSSKKFKTHIQFAFWDRYKVMRFQAVDLTAYVNLVNLTSFALKADMFGLPLLRGLDIQVESRNIVFFTRLLLLRLMLDLPPNRLAGLFFGGDISSGELQGADLNVNTTELRKALAVLVQRYFVAEDEAGTWIPQVFDVVTFGLCNETNEDGEPNPDHIIAAKKEILIEALPQRIELVRKALRDGLS